MRYTLEDGKFGYFFKDTQTDEAMTLDKVLRILNKNEELDLYPKYKRKDPAVNKGKWQIRVSRSFAQKYLKDVDIDDIYTLETT